jgi:UDP-2,4-diacetamido-2,4,6-trideoxy-beta-L-altropyranose hydrolase
MAFRRAATELTSFDTADAYPRHRLRVLIRADAGPQIGAGHLMRCLALAQALQDRGGRARFVMSNSADALEKRIEAEGLAASRLGCPTATEEDLKRTIALAQEDAADWVILDGYRFDANFQEGIQAAGLRLMVIDDFGQAGRYAARVIVDQNLTAREESYHSRDTGTQLLLGLHYALLRREFRSWSGWTRDIPTVARRVLVTLGGATPDEGIMRCLGAIEHISDGRLSARIVRGPLSSDAGPLLRQRLERASPRCQVLHSVSNMAELMAWADLAITAGGSTCWELACLGLPALILTYSRDQELVAEAMQTAKAAVWMGSGVSIREEQLRAALAELAPDDARRSQMSQAGRRLVDGRGAERVLSALEEVMDRPPTP